MSKMVIWKFTLLIKDRQAVTMPIGAEILSVQMQGQTLCLWAMVEPDAVREQRTIEIIGTGNPIADVLTEGLGRLHIGTVQMMSGSLVWHVFELYG